MVFTFNIKLFNNIYIALFISSGVTRYFKLVSWYGYKCLMIKKKTKGLIYQNYRVTKL